ncbi:MAG: hypothetical protein LBI18_09865 [Planctomycetaceae bacterium]|jgi:hypothetical protein|nr:hypothetical protein [Planctomycetaceae bacterium]
MNKTTIIGIYFLLSILLIGCKPQDGVTRFDLSGSVTYNGKPIPSGTIMFLPDVTQNNMGSPGFAVIENGQYNTNKKGNSPVGGPHEIVIDGRDGVAYIDSLGAKEPQGKKLFEPYSLRMDLPKKSRETIDFDVPTQ